MTDEAQTTTVEEPQGGGGDSADQQIDRAEVERKARDIGWKPREQWKGDASGWVDADEFVRRSETFLPYLQHERGRLKSDLDRTNSQLSSVQRELQETREQLTALREFNEEMAGERRDRRKAEINDEIKVARESGNEVRVAELQNELQGLVKPAEKKAPPANPGNGTQPVIQPWVKGFIEGNADFMHDPDRVALFNNELLRRRQAGDTRVGEVEGIALLTEARDAVEAKLGGTRRSAAPSKTEEPNPTGGSRTVRSGGKGYSDMPAEARAKCDAQEKRFVGASGKAFKTQAEWRAHYAKEFFSPSTRAIERATE